MADIDYFKKINDTYGHLVGDECLIQVAKVMKHCARDTDCLIARFGGEEFILLLPGSDNRTAIAFAERIRKSTEQLSIFHEGESICFTISLGIATTVPTAETKCIELITNADQSLYLAKEGGRNRVETLDSYTRKLEKPINQTAPATENHAHQSPKILASTNPTPEIMA